MRMQNDPADWGFCGGSYGIRERREKEWVECLM